MDISVFALVAAAYAVLALVTVAAGRHLRHAPLIQAVALAAACWLVPANLVAGVHDRVEERPGVVATGLIVLNVAGLLAIVGLVVRLGQPLGGRPRPRRALAVAAHRGDIEGFGSGAVAELAERPEELAEAIESMLRRHDPDLVITYAATDQQPEHRAVHAAAMRAVGPHRAILCCDSPYMTGERIHGLSALAGSRDRTLYAGVS